MTGRHYRRVVLVLKGSRTKVDESNLGVEKDSALGCLAVDGGGRRGYSAAISEGLILIITQKNVLRLQVGMDKIKVM